MTIEINVGGSVRRVERRGAATFLDGHRVEVDVVNTGRAWSVLLGRRSYEVFADRRTPGSTIVHVNGRAVAVAGGPRRFGTRGAPASGGDAQTPRHVVMPMPGRVARVLVKAGDQVSARQGLVVVEAMKMENELRSPRAGTVVEVRATEGALVDAHTVLLVIE